MSVMEEPNYMHITGWGTLPEIYPYVAFNCATSARPAKFVEVGVAFGRSLAYLAHEIQLAGREGAVELYAVDIWSNQKQYNIFSANMKECGVSHMIKPIRTYSHMASLGFADQSLDFVYLDGDHRYKAVLLDINSWYPKIKPGGFIGGHDLCAPKCEGVKKAVDEVIGVERYNIWGSSWFYQIP